MFLRTERLFLRPAWLEDAPELTRAIGQEPVVRMLATAPWPYREEHARAWIATPKDPRLPSLLVTLPDEGGRIVLETDMLAHAGIEDKVRFVGLGDRFQIWAPAAHQALLPDIRKLALSNANLLKPKRIMRPGTGAAE